MIAWMVPGSTRTSTRWTAYRLPNRFVTCRASSSAMRPVGCREMGPGAAPARAGAAPRPGVRLPHLEGGRLAFAHRDELAVLHLDQRALLDRVAGVLAVE